MRKLINSHKPQKIILISIVMLSCLLILSKTSYAGNAVIKDTALKNENKKTASLGMGLNGIADWSTQMPFLDLMKQSRPWNDWGPSANKAIAFDTDNNGWIRSLQKGQTAGTVFLVSPKNEPVTYKRYIVLYEGEGRLNYRWSAKKIIQESKPGRDVITVGPDNNLIEISETNPNNYLRNIKIIPEQHIKHYLLGNIFNPDWVQRIKGFNTLRYMDWMGTNNSQQSSWANRPLINDRTWATKGVPLEVMIALSNLTHSNPWFNIPHLADKNYIALFAATVKKTLNNNLIVYIEHSNEVWNWQFKQAQYANTAGNKKWGNTGTAYMQWHGMQTAKICDTFKKEIFTEAPSRIKCVLGVQTGWHGLETDALNCPKWVKENNAPCYSHGFDYIGITSYFDGMLNGPRTNDEFSYKKTAGSKKSLNYEQTLEQWANNGASGLNQAFEQLKTGAPLKRIEQLKNYKGINNQLTKNMTYWKKVSAKYNLGLVAYEGGQHITSNGHLLQENSSIIQFHQAINDDPRMQLIYQQHLINWKNLGGELNVHFVDINQPTKWGSWGALKRVNQASSPKWDALIDFNTKVKCWWYNCKITIPADK